MVLFIKRLRVHVCFADPDSSSIQRISRKCEGNGHFGGRFAGKSCAHCARWRPSTKRGVRWGGVNASTISLTREALFWNSPSLPVLPCYVWQRRRERPGSCEASNPRRWRGGCHGLGGCPYAAIREGGKAKGNVATEVIVAALEEKGYQTNIDQVALARWFGDGMAPLRIF